jgi:dienelactone hydrolase
MRARWLARVAALTLLGATVAIGGTHVRAGRDAPVGTPWSRELREVATTAGRVRFDLYRPSPLPAGPRPLVVVAHGFSRSRAQMAGWGRHLATQGDVVAVPDLPAWADHSRNGAAIRGLVASLLAHPPAAVALDPARVALIGFSAGGLATLLAAADDPGVRVWIGLDPVDRDGLGARAAARLQARAVVILAEPSACNARGNARDLIAALGDRVQVVRIPGAPHVDAEWPTSLAARAACGGTDETRRQAFVSNATEALGRLLAAPHAPRP